MSNQSRYSEAPDATSYHSEEELKHLRFLLRRLQYLETNKGIAEKRGPGEATNLFYVSTEISALTWVLSDCDYLYVDGELT